MTIERDINKVMIKLRLKATQKGVWENFGQKEVINLKNKYGDVGLIRDFEKWCIDSNDRNIYLTL